MTATQGEERFIASKRFDQYYEAIFAIVMVTRSFERLKISTKFMTNYAIDRKQCWSV